MRKSQPLPLARGDEGRQAKRESYPPSVRRSIPLSKYKPPSKARSKTVVTRVYRRLSEEYRCIPLVVQVHYMVHSHHMVQIVPQFHGKEIHITASNPSAGSTGQSQCIHRTAWRGSGGFLSRATRRVDERLETNSGKTEEGL
jgi:hypothetical protein